ncbi:MAG: chorismate mutase [Methylocystis sp.]|nr:chorismate mutase [Methylocystis sp.]
MTEDRLKGLREEIDRLDDRILELLNRRAGAVIEVGKIKTDRNLRFYVPEREVEILRRLVKDKPGPFPSEALPRATFASTSASSLGRWRHQLFAEFGCRRARNEVL